MMMELAARLSSTTEIRNSKGPETSGPFLRAKASTVSVNFMRNMHVLSFTLMLALSISTAHGSQRLDPQAVEKATFSGKLPAGDHTSPLLIKVEVLLDRLHISPGEIDGKLGENVKNSM